MTSTKQGKGVGRKTQDLTNGEIINASRNLLKKYGEKIRKLDVRLLIMLNKRTKNYSDREKDKIVDKIWKKINEIIINK